MSARHPKCCTCQTESSSCQKFQCEDSSQNTIVDPSSSNTARATKNNLQNHMLFGSTPAKMLARFRKCHACHADEKVSDILCLSGKTMFQTSKCLECPTLATKNGHDNSKNERGAPVKRDLRNRA